MLLALLILNPFVLVPLVSMFDGSAGMSALLFFITIGIGSLFVVPILWIVGIVQAAKRKNRLRELIQKAETGYAEYWYYLVYTAGRMATRTSRDSQNNRVAPEPYNDLPLHAHNTAWRGRGVFFLSYSGFFACCPARVNIPFTLP